MFFSSPDFSWKKKKSQSRTLIIGSASASPYDEWHEVCVIEELGEGGMAGWSLREGKRTV